MRLISRFLIIGLLASSGLVAGAPGADSAAGIGIVYIEKAKQVPAKTVAEKLTVKCPEDTLVAGGGASIGGTLRGATLLGSHPIDDRDRGTVPDDGWRAVANNLTKNRQTMGVWAACAYNLSLEYRLVWTGVPAGTRQTAGSFCASNQEVVGGGLLLKPLNRRVFLEGSLPRDDTSDADATPDNGWIVRANNGSRKDGSFLTWAICGSSALDVSYVANPRVLNPNTANVVWTYCGTGSSASSGGMMSQTDALYVLGATMPVDFQSGDTHYNGWNAVAWNRSDTVDNANFTTVCLFP